MNELKAPLLHFVIAIIIKIYCNFLLSLALLLLGIFSKQLILFPAPPTNLHSSSTQQFNSITLFLSPLSLFYLPIPSTSPPIIKLSFKDNPSLSLFLSLIYNEPLWSIPTYTKIMLLMVPELVICHT